VQPPPRVVTRRRVRTQAWTGGGARAGGDESRHTSGVVGPPPSICVWGWYANGTPQEWALLTLSPCPHVYAKGLHEWDCVQPEDTREPGGGGRAAPLPHCVPCTIVHAQKCVCEDRVAEGVPAPRGKGFEIRGLGGNSPIQFYDFQSSKTKVYKYKTKYLKEIRGSMTVRASRLHRSR
jgi:hypothetical protein